ncbi:WD repeat domain phosphoinositide-interacting protein 2-like isoform X3 [Mytilus californianus]|uniref:WD repeat domain phosphoinositide-interacting protein 2-like isoform X2 n=1 Tax=Mytilus californianus TaxID=6549 RepID=UPI0022451DBF|nr:WD repeat domain phosphoinositide-interacting protein 2-like isoform X2 [Mytilus californianus]XP_052070717.1 WD repeat domain phosphoinositide-interacting protein 2-like isoform X3 [Mytilus californianus]
MNLAIRSGDHPSDLLFVNFNQDCTSLAVGSKSWYRLYSLNTVDKLESIYENESEDVCIVERLFSSSLVAIVSISSPRKLKVCHFKKGTEICNYSYSNSILAVKLNRQRLIVCLEESLYIHNIRDMKVLHTIRDTPPNLTGLCALSINNDNCFLAYPGSNQIGEVQIFDTINLRAVTMIPAHDNPLAAIAFNAQGNRVATASEKGTVIRVFSVPDGQKLFEFRRGVKRCATIYSLAFSVDSMFLAASSSTETVHVFKLETPKDNKTEEPQGWMGYFGQALKTSANYLPTQVTELFHQGRAFATARLPSSGLINVCALSVIQKIPRLLVASQDGYLYIFNLDPTDSNECVLVRQHRLDGLTGDSHVTEVTPYDKPLTHQQSTTSYASTVKKQEPTVGVGSNMAPPDSIAKILDSEPYQEMDQGATGGDDLKGLGQLRLDDDNEFPPMTHKND